MAYAGALGLLASVAIAGIDDPAAVAEPGKRAPDLKPVAVQGNDPSVLSARRLGKGRHTIRCWQEGRLVYEAAGVSPVGRVPASFELRGGHGTDVALQIVDLRQGFCVLEVPPTP